MTTAISTTEKDELHQLERVIESGLKTFVDVGLALVKIRDGRLYRVEHGTFEDYCQARWSMTKSRANQLIGSSEVVGNLTTVVAKPANEAQARPLTRLPPEKQAEAWEAANEKAKDDGRKVAARDVEEVVVEMVETKTKEVKKVTKGARTNGSFEDWRKLKAIIEEINEMADSIEGLKVDAQHVVPARDLCQSVADRFQKLTRKIVE